MTVGFGGERPPPAVHIPASLGYALTRLLGLLLRDVVHTRDEVDGLLTSHGAPESPTRLA